MRKTNLLILALLLGATSGLPTACDGGSVTLLDAAPERGQIQLELTAASDSGAAYQLRQAIIVVQGPSSTTFLDSEQDPESHRLEATVPLGSYTAFLQQGWSVERSLEPGGKSQAVPATLLSPNPFEFSVNAGGTTRVPLRFSVGEGTLDVAAFELELAVQAPAAPSPVCSSNSDCAAGQTCCQGGFLGTCQNLALGAACSLPDLVVSAETARASLSSEFRAFPPGSCALEEGCVDGAGVRRLLRFSTQTANVGGSDIVLGDPGGTPGFEFAPCHGHFHFEGYAEYQLLDATGAVAAAGHKQAFCLLDSESVGVPGAPASPRFHCQFQGIQRGWSDVYGSGLDCQWVDITAVPPGDYTLRIRVNPDRVIEEADYTNNSAEVPVRIDDTDALAACSDSARGLQRDCGWSFAEQMRGLHCQPGELITLGCASGDACSTGGVCQGDPMLRVCEGNSACLGFSALALSDDACGRCPEIRSFACPASGTYSVLTGSYDSTQPSVCQPTIGAALSLLSPCSLTGEERDCGWTLSPEFSSLGCPPGQVTTVGCGCSTGGVCGGDTLLRVCAGSQPCSFTQALMTNDDACGRCSEGSFVCPSDGVYTVMTGAYAGGEVVCQPAALPAVSTADAGAR